MKTVTKTYKVYKFDELSDKAQTRAIIDEVNHFANTIDWSCEEYIPDYVQKAIDKSEEMKTPWFFGDYIYEYGKDMIALQLEDYEFYESGEIHNY
jgi:phosphodiesterase/alkaline phosphatase D-like protein